MTLTRLESRVPNQIAARVAGLVVLVGWVLMLATGLLFAAGSSVGIGGSSVGSSVFAAALACIAIGTVAIALLGAQPFGTRAVRLSLGVLGFGLCCATAGALISAASAYDPLENWTVVVLLLGGGLVTGIGVLASVFAFLWRRGPTRVIAELFAAGILAAWAAGFIVNTMSAGGILRSLALLLAMAGGLVVVGAGAGIGLLAMRGHREGQATP